MISFSLNKCKEKKCIVWSSAFDLFVKSQPLTSIVYLILHKNDDTSSSTADSSSTTFLIGMYPSSSPARSSESLHQTLFAWWSRVVSNKSKCAQSSCWIVPNQNQNEFEYAAHKNCFETHRLIDSSRANFNSTNAADTAEVTLPTIDQKLFHSFSGHISFFYQFHSNSVDTAN